MMDGGGSGRGRRLRRRGCDAAGPGGSAGRLGGGKGKLSSPAVTRTFLALAASAAEDLSDRDGIARPLLRRGALRLTTSARTPVQRLGAGYLRYDPPTPEELAHALPPEPPRVIGAAPAARGENEAPLEDAETVPPEDAEITPLDEAATESVRDAGEVGPR